MLWLARASYHANSNSPFEVKRAAMVVLSPPQWPANMTIKRFFDKRRYDVF